jgi:hypothetical protein
VIVHQYERKGSRHFEIHAAVAAKGVFWPQQALLHLAV